MSFATEDALSAQLRDWNEEYQKYSARLWQRGVRTYAHLANAAEGRYKAAGVDNEFHIDDIKAKAGIGHTPLVLKAHMLPGQVPADSSL